MAVLVFFDQTRQIARDEKIDHQILDANQLKRRFPYFETGKSAKGYFEPTAGLVFPERVIRTQLNLAADHGARIRVHQAVKSLRQKENWVEIHLQEEVIHARQVILSAGGWVKDFVDDPVKKKLKICRQVLHWVKMDPKGDMSPLNSVFMWGYGPEPTDFLYGFPSLDGETVKIATEQFEDVEHPDMLERSISLQEQQDFWEKKLKGKFPGLLPEITRSEVCFYTVTPDARFVMKAHPTMDRVQIVSACSGHGFKHASALGEMLAQQILLE